MNDIAATSRFHRLFPNVGGVLVLFLLFLPSAVFAQRNTVRRPSKAKTEQSAQRKKSTGNNPKPKPSAGGSATRRSTGGMSKSERSRILNSLISDMVYVEGGTFTMGATSEQGEAKDDEKPAHRVALSGFSIGRHEVTQREWRAVMGSDPSQFRGDNRPVERVRWTECQTFIRRLNALTGRHFRLPTEAEWEYAARGGNRSKGYKYAGSDNPDDVAWHYGNGGNETHNVGTKSPNELGLYDMSGNVWEWCQDWYGGYPSSAQTNPTGAAHLGYEHRVVRGGRYDLNADYGRVSRRYNLDPNSRPDGTGLRLAL